MISMAPYYGQTMIDYDQPDRETREKIYSSVALKKNHFLKDMTNVFTNGTKRWAMTKFWQVLLAYLSIFFQMQKIQSFIGVITN